VEALMTTSRDLFIVAMDEASDPAVEPGDLSLGLAGAEVIDLLDARAIGLDGDRIVPHDKAALPDRLLNDAASSLVRQAPYESVTDWLWRRGRHLSAAYLAVFEAQGRINRRRYRRWVFFRATRTELVDSPERRWAVSRWVSGEPALGALAVAVGVPDRRVEDSPRVADDAVARVLTAVDDAIGELATERRRRARRLEDAAEYNRERGY
jgi:hypothetical protein